MGATFEYVTQDFCIWPCAGCTGQLMGAILEGFELQPAVGT